MTESPQQAALRLAAAAIRQGFELQALHVYTDARGQPLHWRIRLKRPKTGVKWIRPMKLNGTGYTLGEPVYPGGKPLYRLHELAERPTETVIVTEGEYKADKLAALGLLVTTSGAADSADKADWRTLVGRDVLIWADHDDAGHRYAAAVTAALRALGCSVRQIDVAALNLRPKGDAVEWLEAHPDATKADILALATTERSHRPEGDATVVDQPSASADWPDPKPIQAALRPVPAFDPGTLLPEALRGWIVDEADRMPCPPEFIAAAALVALGAIIGARCAIKPKARDTWLIVPNLWGGIVGDPSAKKSPAIGAALKPLERLIARAMETYQVDMEAFEAEKMVFDARREAIEARIKTAAKAKDGKGEDLDSIAKELQGYRRQAPCAPMLRRFKSNDPTIEKLGELLRDNPTGLLVVRDELVGLIASWDREGREGERAFYLEAWNGNASFDTDRIGRGSIFIQNLCVSIFGGIQPDKLMVYLEQAANMLANDGMLQRFQMLLYPDPLAWEWRDRMPDKAARDQAFTVFERLADFDPEGCGAAPNDDVAKFPYFRFDDAAQEIFIEWSGDLHRVRLPAEDHPLIAQHLAKFDKLYPALALILHLIECAATGIRGPVTAISAMRAAAWCEYLEAHARRCYGLLIDDGLRAAQALVDKLRQGKLADSFTARDVRRHQWRSLTTDESVQAALDWLEAEDWLRGDEVGGTGPGSGRRTVRYAINPKVLKPCKPGGGHGELA
ncbi:uncharacterized protein DUF3987 [Plasticicumulans lactativorans]|uniref:Uncharacterized protein DUF3987 n=1 Tax=Plasticicumulans lactativorans TaxID=1133106 RepID=A0A4R2LIL9_9GAMM|nr:YfjI family protein [Plasticicumulans lactativorans]TCO82995.1 uncharacterized protein DUF3987 [Plasticicumulans lactativorans]